ncbi:hypothetical protein CMV_027973 [Castanea mollissima]|uniref:DUF4408 domain-containing protein n=1 Tax=Castanea mollissima TaxID=60419 RepID=A0A8J4V5L2_9ROSI|nr:hypothetical protein CMV_027973 [Castanea mollissima]
MGSTMFSMKAILISTGVVFMGLGLKASVPMVMKFSTSHVPVTWASLLSWLKPPYVYVIINGIIITIAVSSRFHHRHHHHSSNSAAASSADHHHPYPTPSSADTPPEDFAVPDDSTVVPEVKNIAAVVVNKEEEEDEFVAPSATWTPEKEVAISSEYLSPAEKPLVSERFGHRKPARASPEGARALRVAKPKRHETLENTWKAITEGRAMPLSRHMKKSDTWENHGRDIHVDSLGGLVKKSETFKDRTNLAAPEALALSTGPGLGPVKPVLLRKEPSLSQDELNRRVEAFINKFNEEMRLQRQESLNQYMEMINRGAH